MKTVFYLLCLRRKMMLLKNTYFLSRYNMTMAKLLSDYIFKKSFPPFGHKICVRNETSHTQFIKTELVLIKELREDGLVLELPINVCQRGHTLSLFFLNFDYRHKIILPDSGSFKEAIYEVMAKVEEVEINNCNKDSVFLVLHFTQYDQIGWKKILNLYSQNQDALNELLMTQHRNREKA